MAIFVYVSIKTKNLESNALSIKIDKVFEGNVADIDNINTKKESWMFSFLKYILGIKYMIFNPSCKSAINMSKNTVFTRNSTFRITPANYPSQEPLLLFTFCITE